MSRTRHTYVRFPEEPWSMTKTYWDGQDGSGGAVSTVSGEADAIDINTDMTDVVTPNYYSRSAKGEIFNNPMSSSWRHLEPCQPTAYSMAAVRNTAAEGSTPKLYGQTYNGTRVLSSSQLGSFLDAPTPYLSTIESLRGEAINQAHANASSSEIMLLATLGEGQKSVASMVSILRRVIKIRKSVMKWDLKYLRKQITRKELEDRYMEVRYALRPIMYDTGSVIAAMETSKLEKESRQTYRGYKEYSQTVTDLVTYELNADIRIDVRRTTDILVEIRAGVLCDVVLSDFSVWGLDQWLETALELTPLTFIFNWFFNIAETLAAWTPSAGIRPLASWVTTKTSITQRNVVVHSHLENSPSDCHEDMWWWTLGPASKTFTTKEVERVVEPNRAIVPAGRLQLDYFKLIDLTIIFGRMLSARK